jgi:hypothetical protein
LWQFQAGIDLNAAQGNPVLLDSLLCAQENAQISFNNSMSAIEAIEPLISMVNNLLSVVGMDPIEVEFPDPAATTPTLSELSGDVDPIEPVRTVRDAIQIAYEVLDTIC